MIVAGRRTPVARIENALHNTSLTGGRLGAYQIGPLLGAGGMGEVYRAHDPKLARDVAIKVLPSIFTDQGDRVARFEREARVLAALNHPNIAAIYGFEEFDTLDASERTTVRALVMELVAGETLADRIRKDARAASDTARDEALRMAVQIADALDAAHEKGIIHRDLKPSNVAITREGIVKVLDFGLAKLSLSADIHDTSDPFSTATFDGTREGAVMGTAAYMSPEQARGQAVDKRTDIWAFGCVLYEMLSGRAAFARATTTDTLAAILHSQPEWDALPQSTPERVRRLLRRCLEKDAKRRARDIGDVRLDLEEALSPDGAAVALTSVSRPRIVPGWVIGSAGLVAGASIAVLTWASRPAIDVPDVAVTRTTLTLPPNQELDTGGGAGPLAISPDGRRLAYVAAASGRTQLFVRSLDAFEARAIEGTDGAQYPFFSPDGDWVAFFADRKLKRVAIRGGSPLTVCDVPIVGRGGTWGDGGTIVFDPGRSGLMRVAAAGGRAELLTSRDPATDKQDLSWPQFLPGRRALVATVGRTGSVDTAIAALSLDTREWHQLGRGSQAQYLSSGYLIYHANAVREGELHAVGFDPDKLTLRGNPFSVIDGVFRAQDAGAAYFAFAQNGTLIFAPGGYARTLVRVDRNGRRTPLLDERRGFRRPEISPEGSRLAVTIDPRPSQIWVYDLARKSRIAIATEGHSLGSLWTPDGRRITYAAEAPPDIFWRAADAGTGAERLLARGGPQYPTSWSADGSLLVFDDGEPNAYDIWVLPLHGDPWPLVATPASELGGQLSRDGHWIAYHSNESGRFEVYVRPFPKVNDGKWTISTGGGQRAVWSRDGRELFYAVESSIMRVAVEARGQQFLAGTPERLFDGPFDTSYTHYAVSKDGASFIAVEVDPHARPTQLHLVLHWAEEVKRLANPTVAE